MKRVGLIGLGAMGNPMAERLQKAGFLACVYNRTRAKALPFGRKGVYVAASPAELAKKCDVIISIVSDDVALRNIMLGREGALRSFAAGGIVLEMSTTGVEVLIEVAKEAKKHGVDVLDAPVSGIPTDAEKGDLTIMVGGKKEVLDACRDLLRPIATAVLHVGEIGSGREIKYANNMLVSINLMAALEVTSFIMKTDVDPQKFVDTIRRSKGNSWAFSRFIPDVLSAKKEEHGFTLSKDLDLALDLSSQLGVATPFTSLAKEYLRAANSSKTRGQHDQTVRLDSLVEVFEKASDVNLSRKMARKGSRLRGE